MPFLKVLAFLFVLAHPLIIGSFFYRKSMHPVATGAQRVLALGIDVFPFFALSAGVCFNLLDMGPAVEAYVLKGLPEKEMLIILYVIYVFIFSLFLYCVYAAVMEAVLSGQTPGKKFLRITVCNKDESKAGIQQCLYRNLVKFFSLIFFFLSFYWLISDRKRRVWHDLLAGTLVVNKKQ